MFDVRKIANLGFDFNANTCVEISSGVIFWDTGQCRKILKLRHCYDLAVTCKSIDKFTWPNRIKREKDRSIEFR